MPKFTCGCIVGGGREMLAVCGRPAVALTFTAHDCHPRCVQHAGGISGLTVSSPRAADGRTR